MELPNTGISVSFSCHHVEFLVVWCMSGQFCFVLWRVLKFMKKSRFCPFCIFRPILSTFPEHFKISIMLHKKKCEVQIGPRLSRLTHCLLRKTWQISIFNTSFFTLLTFRSYPSSEWQCERYLVNLLGLLYLIEVRCRCRMCWERDRMKKSDKIAIFI